MNDRCNNHKRRRLFCLTWILVFVVLAISHILIFARLVSLWQSQEDSSRIHHYHDFQKRHVHRLEDVSTINQDRQLQQQQAVDDRKKQDDLRKLPLRNEAEQQIALTSLKHSGKIGKDVNRNGSKLGLLLDKSLLNRQSAAMSATTGINEDDPSIVKLRGHGIDLPTSEWQKLPTWKHITDTLGNEPVILGLEQCAKYRKNVPADRRYVAPSGAFNAGTNLFPVAFINNCQLGRDSILMQPPWGKHNLVDARLKNYRINRKPYENYQNEDALPVILVRHPISWMFSTCVHSYAAFWEHDLNNCPNLVNETTGFHNSVRVAYGYRPTNKKFLRYDSLIHMWTHWYRGYVDKHLPFPRLIIRLEDLVYHSDKVLHQICECAGGKPLYPNRILPEESVKTRKDRERVQRGLNGTLAGGKETAGLLKAWTDHASTASLWERMTKKDKRLVKLVLERDDSKLLELFHYKLEGK
jgi:hypothetical protein